MLRRMICVVMAGLMLCLTSCGFDFLRGETTEDKASMPTINLPALPATVNGYGGSVTVESIKLGEKYNKTEKSMSGKVSLMVSGGDNGTSGVCLVDFNVLDENGVIVDSGNMGDGNTMNIGDKYEGTFYIMSVEPGKTYTLKFINS